MIRAAIDTSALLALASSRDQYHRRAVAIEQRFRKKGGRWLATTLVLAELHGHLLRRIDPQPARRVISALLADPVFEWHDSTADLVEAAIERWIVGFADQRFSLTDAVTFELMRAERVNKAFAFDQDFVTAGFELLP
ncbi:MAG: PIN domain-containing protein [Gemmatimonadetes bacterium]|nr:PIN domain-containing protein [Gemmatimonadota bacterium]